MKNYLTIARDGEHEFVEKKSRFICHLKRVKTEDEAREFILSVKKLHFKARHNCSAFVLGTDSAIKRSSDDGEPSGTAGIPILEVLLKNELTDVVAVVTRYFGGIKLGAGGLIRAYSTSVSEAVATVGIAENKLVSVITFSVEYPLYSPLENFISSSSYTLNDSAFDEKVTLSVLVDSGSEEQFEHEIRDLTSGKYTIISTESKYIEIPTVF
ncbi:MAG: YigZ family protein [Lactobacillales bacterium]|jgi:uncharacterized YigZ family protein|nr:YigZ family protein [Lactobacillales bacterium]